MHVNGSIPRYSHVLQTIKGWSKLFQQNDLHKHTKTNTQKSFYII